MPVHQAQLAHPHWQVPVAPQAALIGQDAAGAVHGLDGIVLIINFKRIHVIPVVFPVAALLPQRAGEDDRCLDLFIPCLAVDLPPIVFQGVAQHHALGIEEGEAGACLHQVKQVQFPAQLAVVALFSLLDLLEVGLQVFLVGKSGAVDTLEHLVFFAPPPVGAGEAGELEGLDAPGRGQVRARAQVDKVALAVEGQLGILRQVVDQLHLVRLPALLHKGDGLVPRQGEALLPVIFLDDALHFLFDAGKVLRGEDLLHVKVIVKAVVNGGADGELGARKQVFDSTCHHVAGRVAQHVAGIVILKADGGQLAAFV